MSYVIAASPLAKIFMDREIIDPKTGESMTIQKKCLEDPDFINNEDPFELTVKRPSGAILLTFGIPKDITSNNQSDERSLIFWLTGGPAGDQCQETDCYGLAEFAIGFDTTQLLHRNMELNTFLQTKGKHVSEETLSRVQDEQNAMMGRMNLSIESAHKKARDVANMRVKKALKQMYSNLQRQWEINQEAGVGRHMPSNAEALGAHILQDEIMKSTESRQKMIQKMNHIMDAVRI